MTKGSLLILTNLLSNVISISQENLDNNDALLYIIVNVAFQHIVLIKTVFYILNFTRKNYKFLRGFFIITFIITFNYNLNYIHYLYKQNTIYILFQLLLNNRFIIIYWFILLIVSLYIFEIISRKFQLKKIIKRKLFHLLGLLIYIPGIKYMNTNLLLAISIGIVYIFILIEIFRNKFRGSLLFMKLNTYLENNIDDRDDKQFILTHIFLLFGCFSSVLFSKIENRETYLYYLGITILGVGDSFASIVGSKYGRNKIFPPTNRTLEGTTAGVTSTFISLILFSYQYVDLKSFIKICIIFLYEGFTLEIDNLVLPIFAYKLFCL